MKREDVIVKPGYEYDHFFPRAKLITIVKKKGARVSDTLKLIPAIIRETAFHTRDFANKVIRSSSEVESCRKVWQFVFDYIAYKKDEDGKEQVRSPARTWHDRHNLDENGKPMGVDCDCMTVFIVSVLYNLGIKNIFFRITKYQEDHFEHIYPIVILPNGKQITIDAVVYDFNYETPYSEKQDTPMDLEYLNGVTHSVINRITDGADLMGSVDEKEALAALGRIFKKKSSGGSAKKGLLKKPVFHKKTAEQKKARKEKVKKFVGKGLHVTNRINPATVALRNGVLASMKLNFMKVAESLRYSYLSPDQAKEKGMYMAKYPKLVNVREKLEKIFYGAGGKPENLKKAILTGRGNRDKAVALNGLGYISDENVDGLNEDMSLPQLLGRDIFYSENIEGLDGLDGFEGLEGFGELGELGVATAASVAAATTVMTSIAALVKSIGSLFPNKTNKTQGGKANVQDRGSDSGAGDDASASENGSANSSEDNSGSSSNADSSGSGTSNNDASGSSDPSGGTQENGTGAGSGSGDDNGDGGTNGSDNSTNEDGNTTAVAKGENKGGTPGTGSTEGLKEKAKSFWENNKKWLKPSAYIGGSLALIALAYKLLAPKPKPKLSLNGIKSKKKTKKNLLSGIGKKKTTKPISKNNSQKKKRIELL